MKILKIIALSFGVLFFQSCDDDDAANPDNSEYYAALLGSWTMTSLDYSGYNKVSAEGQSFTTDFVGFGKDMDGMLVFTSDPDEYISSGSYTIELTTTTLGISNTIDQEINDLFNNGVWSLDNQELTMSIVGQGSQAVEITKLTENELIMEAILDQKFSAEGIATESYVKSTFTFSK